MKHNSVQDRYGHMYICTGLSIFLTSASLIILSSAPTTLECEEDIGSEQADIVDRIIVDRFTEALEKERLSPQKRFMMPLSFPIPLPRSQADYAKIATRAPAIITCGLALAQCIAMTKQSKTGEAISAAANAALHLPIIYDPSVLRSGPATLLLFSSGVVSGVVSCDQGKVVVTSPKITTGHILFSGFLANALVCLGYGAVDAYNWYQGRSASDATHDGTTPQVSLSATDTSLLPASKDNAATDSNSQNTATNEPETPTAA